MDFFQHQAFLTARTPRIKCKTCGVKQINVRWARPGSGFTLLFEAHAMTLITHMPVAAVARLVGEHDTRLWRIVFHYIDEALTRVDHAAHSDDGDRVIVSVRPRLRLCLGTNQRR